VSELEGKAIVVTGGASGIGKAISQDLAARGAVVGILDLNQAGSEQVVAEISDAGGRGYAFGVDITDYQAVEDAVTRFEREAGSLYGLVNNAGWDEAKPFVDTEPAFWDKVIAVNLMGPMNVTHVACGRMQEYGEGRVVSIASDAGRVGSSGEAVYSAAKGGMIALMKTLAREFARNGVTFNTVCPGPTDTPLFASVDAAAGGKLGAALQRAIPMRRLALPSDYPEVVRLFLLPSSGYITGQTISVSGGLSMHG
jgi:2-hydroxycyclohexanecarboxyl-CoA dehydrogenase